MVVKSRQKSHEIYFWVYDGVVCHVVLFCAADGDDAVLRCYCNEVACVRTGYMCKTSLGACFAQRDDGHIRYACAHRLDDDSDRRLCLASAAASHDDEADYVIRRRVTSSSSRAEAVAWTELACCSTDMCNYYYFRSQREVVAADVHTTNGN